MLHMEKETEGEKLPLFLVGSPLLSAESSDLLDIPETDEQQADSNKADHDA